MENSEDLKRWIEEKIKTLEAGETEILFSWEISIFNK